MHAAKLPPGQSADGVGGEGGTGEGDGGVGEGAGVGGSSFQPTQ